MPQEWKKFDISSDAQKIGDNFQLYVDQLRQSLEKETLKLQSIVDLLVVELQKHSSNTETK